MFIHYLGIVESRSVMVNLLDYILLHGKHLTDKKNEIFFTSEDFNASKIYS